MSFNKQRVSGNISYYKGFNILVDLGLETVNLNAVRCNQLTSVSSLVTAAVLLLSCR